MESKNINVNDMLTILEERFNQDKERFDNVDFKVIKEKLSSNDDKLKALYEMELTGGEPRLGWINDDKYVFVDFSKETPLGRRNCCYDEDARLARKKFAPETSAIGLASSMGITLLTEKEYRKLQEFGEFDLKTSSWIYTPSKIRNLGGALFCDRRYDTVFVYHNGADSYYGVRGFRGKVEL